MLLHTDEGNALCLARDFVTTLLLFATVAWAQESVKVELSEVRDHRIGSLHLIHTKAQVAYHHQYVTLHVTVDAGGNVESAKGIAGPAEFFTEAEGIEARQVFKPFERDGKAVRASFSDYRSIVPPEEWADTKVPFPEIKDWNTLKMRLTRTTCYGPCPSYSVEVRGDGSVDFDGEGHVLAMGHHRDKISRQAVEELLAAFRRANYFSLKAQRARMRAAKPQGAR